MGGQTKGTVLANPRERYITDRDISVDTKEGPRKELLVLGSAWENSLHLPQRDRCVASKFWCSRWRFLMNSRRGNHVGAIASQEPSYCSHITDARARTDG